MKAKTKILVYAGIFLALGTVLPMIFHLAFGALAGKIFLPMPFVVLLASLVLGPFYGLALGFIIPLISSLITGMPAAAILPFVTFELVCYGFLTGFCKNILKISTFLSLIISMILGRVLLGLFVSIFGKQFGLDIRALDYVITALVTGIPGIIIQVVLIPFIVYRLKVDNYVASS
jgi:niacin transporter